MRVDVILFSLFGAATTIADQTKTNLCDLGCRFKCEKPKDFNEKGFNELSRTTTPLSKKDVYEISLNGTNPYLHKLAAVGQWKSLERFLDSRDVYPGCFDKALVLEGNFYGPCGNRDISPAKFYAGKSNTFLQTILKMGPAVPGKITSAVVQHHLDRKTNELNTTLALILAPSIFKEILESGQWGPSHRVLTKAELEENFKNVGVSQHRVAIGDTVNYQTDTAIFRFGQNQRLGQVLSRDPGNLITASQRYKLQVQINLDNLEDMGMKCPKEALCVPNLSNGVVVNGHNLAIIRSLTEKLLKNPNLPHCKIFFYTPDNCIGNSKNVLSRYQNIANATTVAITAKKNIETNLKLVESK